MATTVTLKPNAIDISGSTSGTTTLQATAVAGTTTLTLPAATDTLVGKATTDTLTNKTLTGAVMNGTLGATTPSTVAATTLTTSSTVTHNGGTANGVAYLDGSKVLTTGSALVFDGTNLGLGVTPVVNASYKGIQLTDLTSTGIYGSGYGTNITTNAYLTGVTTYTRGGNSYRPSKFSSFDGAFTWSTAAAAGTTITWTDAMTLDASGNFGIGTTAPQNRLQVVTTTRPQFSVSYNGTTGLYLEDATVSSWKSWKLSTSFGAGSDLSFVQSTNTSGTPTWAATAAMTLDASGNLLVGTTSTAGTVVGARMFPTGLIQGTRSESTNAATQYDLYSTGAAAYRFYVGMGGTIYATSTTISAISDIRFKENVRDLDVGLSEVMALKPRLYDWKEGKGADTKNARGFIAQEFEEVFPDLIDEWKDPAPEGEEPYKSVRQDLIPVLVKAIQEQQALIQTLTARITALESA
jgi:hypothetical protein